MALGDRENQATAADDEFDNFLQEADRIRDDRQLPILLGGYNPQKLADMTTLADKLAEKSSKKSS